jgi:F-type H+-transporting ATPase subunit b
MNFDLTTFVLEAVNFLVLLWLLQRFFYKPVLKVIDARQQQIKSQIEETNCQRSEAMQLKQQYEQRLDEWDKEKTNLRSSLHLELQAEREKQLIEIRTEIDKEKKISTAATERQMQDALRKCEQTALALAADFVTKLLQELVSPELEKKICEIFVRDLQKQTDAGMRLGNGNGDLASLVEVFTVYPLTPDEVATVETNVNGLAHRVCTYKYSCDSDLIAGIRVVIGGNILQANLRDAICFFRDAGKDGN